MDFEEILEQFDTVKMIKEKAESIRTLARNLTGYQGTVIYNDLCELIEMFDAIEYPDETENPTGMASSLFR